MLSKVVGDDCDFAFWINNFFDQLVCNMALDDYLVRTGFASDAYGIWYSDCGPGRLPVCPGQY